MKNTHGGKRKNVGRKPVIDKKLQVSFYIEQSKIERFGGLKEFKAKIIAHINKVAAK
jgi:hypothetical protein